MPQFCMKIAGHTAHICSLFESTPQYFRAYLTEEAPEFSVTVTREDIAFEQQDLLEEALREGFRPRTFTDPFLVRAAVCRAFGEFLLSRDTLLLHGSAVAVDGKGYLFTAKTGTGKSTHTRFWRQVFGDRAVTVNDAKPFLQLTPDGVILHGSPWSGKHGLDANISMPLKGVCLLERGREDTIHRITAAEAMPMLEKQSYQPMLAENLPQYRLLLEILAARVPLWRMACTKNESAAHLAYSAMSEK